MNCTGPASMEYVTHARLVNVIIIYLDLKLLQRMTLIDEWMVKAVSLELLLKILTFIIDMLHKTPTDNAS